MSPLPVIHVVTVDSEIERAKGVMRTLAMEFKETCVFVHVANCEDVMDVKPVLKSLIIEPEGLICSTTLYVAETEEIREMAQKMLPEMKLITLPSDLGEGKLVAYLREQVEGWVKK